MRFHFIAKEKANFGIAICRMCKVLRVSESGYYAWVSRPASQRQRDDRVYLAHIRAEHSARNYRAYGRKRMTDELRDQGIVIGERRVGRLMLWRTIFASSELINSNARQTVITTTT